MSGELVLFVGRRTLETALLLAGPVLIVALLMGVLVSLFQAVTSMKDMTLGVVLKIGSVGVTLLIAGGWMLQVITGFTREIFDTIQVMTR
jgi:flagellar biosynthetic protein FliQ